MIGEEGISLWMSAEETVDTVLADAGWDDTMRSWALRWCFEANRDLETPVWMERVTTGVRGEPTLIVEGGYIKKPCNLVRVHDLQVYMDGACYKPYYEPFEGELNRHLGIGSTYNPFSQQGYTYTVQVYEEREGFQVSNAEGEEIVMVYDRFALDNDGLPWFDRDALLAMEAYCDMRAEDFERRQRNGKANFNTSQAAMAIYAKHKRRYQGIRFNRNFTQDAVLQLAARAQNPFRGSSNPWQVLANHSTYQQIFSPYQ